MANNAPRPKVVKDAELSYELPSDFNKPRMTVSNEKTNTELIPVPRPPSAIQQILAVGKVVILALAAVSSVVVATAAGGATLPAWLIAAATAIVAIAASLGLVSPGVKALEAPKP